MNRVNVLGLTFDELLARYGAGTGDRKGLRRGYARLCRGEVDSEEGLCAEIAPVVRNQQDGDLVKFIQRLPGGLETESVIIPMQGRQRSWRTLCVSSQVGCAMGCTFCETAQLGRLANLSSEEIVGQVVAARRVFGADIRNVVFMGMGEPFDNFDHVIQAVRVLTDPMGLSLGKAHVTISTVGRTEGIRRLAALGWRRINLAVSLNAPNDDIRSRIMPINRVEPMALLREALLAYPLRRCQFFMVEYVLIPGVNDGPEHADELVEYLRPVKCCLNVIPYNPRRESPWPAPREDDVVRFIERVECAGQFVKRRLTKGRDFMAACGQLGNRTLKAARQSPIESAVVQLGA